MKPVFTYSCAFTGHRRSTICLILLLLAGNGLLAETLRLATYNLRNYLNMDRRVEGYWRTDYPKPESEKAALREIILRISPDVLAIQEIGGIEFLQELQSDLKAEGLDYPYAELMDGPDEDRHLAILSRKAPLKVFSHDKIPFKYFEDQILVKRGLQEVVFENSGIRWSLFNVHLKSRYTDNKADGLSVKRRVGEAQAIRNFIRKRMPPEDEATRYLVAGDFNDHRDSSAVVRFLTVGERTLTELVECVDSRGETWTFHYRKRDLYERVDFILASPNMTSYIRGGSGKIVDILPEANIASDHRLIYIDLDFPDTTQ